LDRIITRILLAFWAVWFALRAFAAFGGGAGGALEHSWARMGAISMGAGLVEMLIGWLLAWAFLAVSLGGEEDADAVLVVKSAFAAAIAFAAAGFLLRSAGAADLSPLDGIATMLLLVTSYVAAMSEAVPATMARRAKPPAEDKSRLVPVNFDDLRIIRFPARTHPGREST